MNDYDMVKRNSCPYSQVLVDTHAVTRVTLRRDTIASDSLHYTRLPIGPSSMLVRLDQFPSQSSLP